MKIIVSKCYASETIFFPSAEKLETQAKLIVLHSTKFPNFSTKFIDSHIEFL